MPREWTPLHRSTTYGLCVAKSPLSLLSFCSPFYFLADFFCLCFTPHSRTSFFSSTFFYSPYFPIVLSRTLPSKILFDSWACPLEVPSPAYFVPLPLFFLLPPTVDFTLIFLYCACNTFFFTLRFAGVFWKIYLWLTIFFFMIWLLFVVLYPQ